MPLKIGDKNIKSIKHGEKEILKIYIGDKLVYQKASDEYNIQLMDMYGQTIKTIKSVNKKIPYIENPTMDSNMVFQGWWTTPNYYNGYVPSTGEIVVGTTIRSSIQHSGTLMCTGEDLTGDIILYAHGLKFDSSTNKASWIRRTNETAAPQEYDVTPFNFVLNITGDIPTGTTIYWTPNFVNKDGKYNNLWTFGSMQTVVFPNFSKTNNSLFFVLSGGDYYTVSQLQNDNWTNLPWTLSCNTGTFTSVSYVNIESGFDYTGRHGIQVNATFVPNN